MRIAILADIHGNLPALEATVRDLQYQQPDVVYLAGDQINRCPWNNDVMALIHDQRWPAIYGNHELIVGRLGTPQNRPPFTDRTIFPILWWTKENLHKRYLAELHELPAELHLTFDHAPAIYLTHGQPGNPFLGFFPESTDESYEGALKEIVEPVVITAHTHRPMIRKIQRRHQGSRLVVNGGSVGMPYNKDPRAQYLLLDLVDQKWQPSLRQVDYNRSLLRSAFESSGMLAEAGPSAELCLRTALTGEPWSSDFGYWYRMQPPEMKTDLSSAIEIYLQQHGPGRWAFPNIQQR